MTWVTPTPTSASAGVPADEIRDRDRKRREVALGDHAIWSAAPASEGAVNPPSRGAADQDVAASERQAEEAKSTLRTLLAHFRYRQLRNICFGSKSMSMYFHCS